MMIRETRTEYRVSSYDFLVSLEKLRNISESIFGQRYRAELMIAIGDSDGIVCMIEIVEKLGVGASKLQRPWQSLVEAELIVRLAESDGRRKYYSRVNSLAWDFAKELSMKADGGDARTSSTETSQRGR